MKQLFEEKLWNSMGNGLAKIIVGRKLDEMIDYFKNYYEEYLNANGFKHSFVDETFVPADKLVNRLEDLLQTKNKLNRVVLINWFNGIREEDIILNMFFENKHTNLIVLINDDDYVFDTEARGRFEIMYFTPNTFNTSINDYYDLINYAKQNPDDGYDLKAFDSWNRPSSQEYYRNLYLFLVNNADQLKSSSDYYDSFGERTINTFISASSLLVSLGLFNILERIDIKDLSISKRIVAFYPTYVIAINRAGFSNAERYEAIVKSIIVDNLAEEGFKLFAATLTIQSKDGSRDTRRCGFVAQKNGFNYLICYGKDAEDLESIRRYFSVNIVDIYCLSDSDQDYIKDKDGVIYCGVMKFLKEGVKDGI